MDIEENIFFDEFKNKLSSLEYSLLNIKNEKYNKEDIDEIFRSVHTIKGTSDLLGLIDVVAITHKAEDLLQYIREGKIELDSSLCSLFLDLKKFIELIVDNVAKGVFDNPMAEKLFIDFEKKFNYQINIAQNAIYEYVELKTILVVDDSTLIRYQIKKIATDEGYNVFTTDSSSNAWQIIQDNAIDLLFCDFSFKNSDSMFLAKNIRHDIKRKDLPIVMLLDRNDEEYNSLGKSILAKAWVVKPIEESQLKVILNKLL